MQAPVVVMNTGIGERQTGRKSETTKRDRTEERPDGREDRTEGRLDGRQAGRQAQLSNIHAAKTVADIIRSYLGPKAMLRMLLGTMGSIALTNDGHAILREIQGAAAWSSEQNRA